MNHLLSNRQIVHDIILKPNSYNVKEYIMKYDQIIEVVLEGTTIKILLKKHNNKYIGKFKEMEFISTGN